MSNVTYLCRGARTRGIGESQMLVVTAFATPWRGQREDRPDFAPSDSVPIRLVVEFLAGRREDRHVTEESDRWQPPGHTVA